MSDIKVQIIYNNETADIFNRKSALGSYIFVLAQILQKVGFQIRVNELELSKGVIRPEINQVTNSNASSLKKKIPLFIKDFLKNVAIFKSMKSRLQQIEQNTDFSEIVEFYRYGSIIGYELSKKYNKKLILVYDGPVWEEHVFFSGKTYFFKRRILNREKKSILQAKAIIVYSNAVKNYLEQKLKCELPVFIHQNVDFSRFEFIETKTYEGTINIGFLGSFLKWHRVDLLIEAFTMLREQHYNVKLFLLGTGLEFETIKKSLDSNKFSMFIEMPGFLDGEELVAYKKEMHIGVMPGSNWYGAPNKIFEYAAAGMAVVAPDTPTIVDLFEDNNELLLFKQDDVQQLFEKLKRLCDDQLLLKHLAVTIQQRIRKCYSEQNTISFYKTLLEAKK